VREPRGRSAATDYLETPIGRAKQALRSSGTLRTGHFNSKAKDPMADSYPATIRIATFADAPALADVHVTSWRETYPGIVPSAMLSSLSVDGRAAMWERIMREPARRGATVVYVAELDRKIVGFGSCGEQRTEALKARGYDSEVSALYVLKARQRQAIGTRLLFAMASDLSGKGFSAASLWVLRDNAPARRFYERCNAQVIAEKEDVREDGVLVEVAYGWSGLGELARLTASLADSCD
jgi:ribosomal protein S18 acetylase RimI-like enzyme